MSIEQKKIFIIVETSSILKILLEIFLENLWSISITILSFPRCKLENKKLIHSQQSLVSTVIAGVPPNSVVRRRKNTVNISNSGLILDLLTGLRAEAVTVLWKLPRRFITLPSFSRSVPMNHVKAANMPDTVTDTRQDLATLCSDLLRIFRRLACPCSKRSFWYQTGSCGGRP